MGNFCKACDQRLSDTQNEIIGEISDSYLLMNRKNKINKIKDKVKLKEDINLNEYIPEIIFLQRNIKKYLQRKHESNQDLFYNKLYSNNINNIKLKEELDIIDINPSNKNNRFKTGEKFKTLSQKYNTISNNSYINYTNEGKQYKVDKLQINENAIYTGQILNGKQHGYGVQEWTDGARYEGEWEKNNLEGFGIYYYLGQRIYIGQWKNNLKEGFGLFIWKDKIYIGFYANDKKNGFGIYYWKNIKKAFMGFWKNGKQYGFGKLITENKIKYVYTNCL